MAHQITVARTSISHHYPFCEPPDHLAMNYLRCHLFTVLLHILNLPPFLALPTWRKTLERAAERSSLNADGDNIEKCKGRQRHQRCHAI
jgi:hypothetical protein